MQKIFLSLMLLLLLSSCNELTSKEISEEEATQEQFLQFISTPVENYEAIYEMGGSTAGASWGTTMSVTVNQNKTVFCKKMCVNSKEGSVTCDGGNECNTNMDFKLKQSLQDNFEVMINMNMLIFFSGSLERSCFFVFPKREKKINDNYIHPSVYCFRSDGLLVNQISSLDFHPNELNVKGYGWPSVPREVWDEYNNYYTMTCKNNVCVKDSDRDGVSDDADKCDGSDDIYDTDNDEIPDDCDLPNLGITSLEKIYVNNRTSEINVTVNIINNGTEVIITPITTTLWIEYTDQIGTYKYIRGTTDSYFSDESPLSIGMTRPISAAVPIDLETFNAIQRGTAGPFEIIIYVDLTDVFDDIYDDNEYSTTVNFTSANISEE